MAEVVIDRLKSQLLTSGLSQKDSALFQIINGLIDELRNALIVTNSISNPGGGGSGLGSQTFLTQGNETGTLPNSLQLASGIGIQFNRAKGKLIINSIVLPSTRSNQEETVRNILGIKGDKGIQGLKGQDSINRPYIEESYRYPHIGQVDVNYGLSGKFNVFSLPGPYTVATLPTGTLGNVAYVTDALAPTFLAAVVGGGAITTPVFKNATTWVGF